MRNTRSKKRFFTTMTAALIFSAVLILPVYAEEPKPTGEAAVSIMSGYVWRGYELSRNSVVIQPSMTIAYKGFSANVWGNLDTAPYYAGAEPDKSYSSAWNETDLTVSYTKTLGLFNVGAGYIYYSLGALHPEAADRLDSQEIFATVGLNAILSPTLTVYKEIDHYRNWYFLLGISHVFELNKMIALKLAAQASYLLSTDETTYPKFDDKALPTGDKFSNFHEGVLTVSLPVKASAFITVTPMVSYIFPLSADAKNEMKGFGLKGADLSGRDSSFFVAGLTTSFAF